MTTIEHILTGLARRKDTASSTIACLYTGTNMPPFCEPMMRSPEPEIGMDVDGSLSDFLSTALVVNPSVHDGAIMMGRRSAENNYQITGWSYRLFPPAAARQTEVNRGSAFNSCLAMSSVRNVDRLYLVSNSLFVCFERGHIRHLAR